MQTRMLKRAIRYGIIGGATGSLYITLIVQTGMVFASGPQRYLGYLAIIVMPVCTFLALKEIRNKADGGRIGFGKALLAGLVVSLSAAAVFMAYTWFDHEVLHDPYGRRMMEETQKTMQEQGKSADEIDQVLMQMEQRSHSFKPYLSTLIWYTLIGIVYSAVSYLLLRYFIRPRKPPPQS